MWRKVFGWFNANSPFTLDTPHLDKFIASIDDIRSDVHDVRVAIAEEKEYLEKELRHKESVIVALFEAIPDMVWYKDIDGKYVYANSAIKDGLLCTNDPIGKTDLELAANAKMKYGADNHQFGESCANSDQMVLDGGAPMRFLENGKVRGKNLELHVHKNVVRDIDTDEIIGTVGTGRDVTEYVDTAKQADCSGCKVVNGFEKDRFNKGS